MKTVFQTNKQNKQKQNKQTKNKTWNKTNQTNLPEQNACPMQTNPAKPRALDAKQNSNKQNIGNKLKTLKKQKCKTINKLINYRLQ